MPAASTVHRLWVANQRNPGTSSAPISDSQVVAVSSSETASMRGATRTSSRTGASPTSPASSGENPAARASSSARSARASASPR